MEVYKNQLWHLIFLLVAIPIIYLITRIFPDTLDGSLFNISTTSWLIISILSAILHQVYVLITWRKELYYQSISNRFGKEKGFKLFKIGFALLILSRLVTITCLAFSNARETISYSFTSYFTLVTFLLPSLYLFYSVKKYFGMDRAFGIDHFYPEKYRNSTFVKRGIFKYTSNGMYVYGFMILYEPGILLQSTGAVTVAFFHHAYIWVHYYCTEKPDMRYIYSGE